MLYEICLIGAPAAAALFFIASLILFLSARCRKKRGEDVSAAAYRLRKALLIVSSVAAGVLVLIGLAFAALTVLITFVGM